MHQRHSPNEIVEKKIENMIFAKSIETLLWGPWEIFIPLQSSEVQNFKMIPFLTRHCVYVCMN